MIRSILSVGGWTLVSRATGFARDVLMAAIMGAGPLADAFVVAFRLPNHFRAIFGEGAFNNAFVPAYARLDGSGDRAAAQVFADRIFTLMLGVQVVVLVLALLAMPWIVRALAPGFSQDPERFALAVSLTRITFPYLLFVTLVTLLSGVLNARRRFAAAAGAPVLLNLSLIAALMLAFLFPSAAHAAAWGVAAAGVLEFLLVYGASRRAGVAPDLVRPTLADPAMRGFFRTLGPAVVGSAGVQIAMFADTIIASFLPTGAVAALYYADRLYQLPVGVVGIAAGTVLLPEMSRRLAAGDEGGAHRAQNRTVALTLTLAMPFAVLFLTLPDLVVSSLFQRGAFDAEAAARAGTVLAAYAVGLPAVVLIRSAVASFYARQDTVTPLCASLAAVAGNVGLKLVLTGPLGVQGLALATSAGAWVNLGLLVLLARRRRWTAPTPGLARVVLAIGTGCALLAGIAVLGEPFLHRTLPALPFRDLAILIGLGLAGALVYAGWLVAADRLLGLRRTLPR